MAVLNVSSINGSTWKLDKIALRQPAMIVQEEDFGSPWLKEVIYDMFETLYSTPLGVGLAAPQVGIQLRLVVIDINRDAKKPIVMINPSYEPLSEEIVTGIESCLSVPGVFGEVDRYDKIKVSYRDFWGNHIETEATGFKAKAFQHEIDHVNGVLFVDRISDPNKIKPDNGLLSGKATLAVERIENAK